jgi:hypothetical protein
MAVPGGAKSERSGVDDDFARRTAQDRYTRIGKKSRCADRFGICNSRAIEPPARLAMEIVILALPVIAPQKRGACRQGGAPKFVTLTVRKKPPAAIIVAEKWKAPIMAEKGIEIIGHAREFAQILVWRLGKHGMKEEHVERI